MLVCTGGINSVSLFSWHGLSLDWLEFGLLDWDWKLSVELYAGLILAFWPLFSFHLWSHPSHAAMPATSMNQFRVVLGSKGLQCSGVHLLLDVWSKSWRSTCPRNCQNLQGWQGKVHGANQRVGQEIRHVILLPNLLNCQRLLSFMNPILGLTHRVIVVYVVYFCGLW